MTIGSIFAAIEAILKLIGLWEQFQAWYDAKKVADRTDESQKLNQAVDDIKNAKSEDDFDKAQSAITSHLPRP